MQSNPEDDRRIERGASDGVVTQCDLDELIAQLRLAGRLDGLRGVRGA